MQGQVKSTWRSTPPLLASEECTVCHGTGWEMVLGSDSVRAKRCSCLLLSRLVEMKERVRIPSAYQDCSFEDYSPSSFSQTRALSEARKFAADYPYFGRDLFFSGRSGVGKTHLAVAIARSLLSAFHKDLLFLDFGRFTALSSVSHRLYPEQRGEWERLNKVSLLIVDNFGLIEPTEAVVTMTQELIRLRRERNRRTIFTGERISCRELFRGRPGRCDSPTQLFLATFHPSFLIEFFGGIKILNLDEGGRRKHTRQDNRARLF